MRSVVRVGLEWSEALAIRELLAMTPQQVERVARNLVDAHCSHSYIQPHIFCPMCSKTSVLKRATKQIQTALRGVNRIKVAMQDTLRTKGIDTQV